MLVLEQIKSKTMKQDNEESINISYNVYLKCLFSWKPNGADNKLNSYVTNKYHLILCTVYHNITILVTLIISLVIPSRLTQCYFKNSSEQ